MSPTDRMPIAYVQPSWHTQITDHCERAFDSPSAVTGLA